MHGVLGSLLHHQKPHPPNRAMAINTELQKRVHCGDECFKYKSTVLSYCFLNDQ